MSEPMIILQQILPFAAPPLIGALIGYLTNKVAIRMLFRPLKRWRIGPVNLPMTPGVIPSKRHDLALNIGEMVGEHLLTSSQISSSLLQDRFQDHLRTLIEGRIGTLMKMDLGPLPAIIPEGYRSYFEIAKKTMIFRLQEKVRHYLQSEASWATAGPILRRWLEALAARPCNELFDGDRRSELYTRLAADIEGLVCTPRMQQFVITQLTGAVHRTLAENGSAKEIIPSALTDMIVDCVGNQSPQVLEKAAELLGEPEIQDKIVLTAQAAMDDFIGSYGPMASMIQNFIDRDKVAKRVRAFLDDPDNEIVILMRDPAVQTRVEAALRERAAALLEQPLERILGDADGERIEDFCRQAGVAVSGMILRLNADGEIKNALEAQLESVLQDGEMPIGAVIERLFGERCLIEAGSRLERELRSALASADGAMVVDEIVAELVEQLLSKPVGKLGDLIPAGVREGGCRSLQEMATTMLISEVPGIVKSLDIRKIVTNRIDSFDLLRLERLLLSIMAEQFKYINLFGAFLGFLIGCINVILLAGFG